MSETIITKQCCRCKQIKSISEYNRASARKDGFQTACKSCSSIYRKEYRATEKGKQQHRDGQKRFNATDKGRKVHRKANKKYSKTKKGKRTHRKYKIKYRKTEKGKQAERQYAQSERGKEISRKAVKKHSKSNPLKIKARNAINHAITRKNFPEPIQFQCSCGNQAKHWHHYKGYAPEHWFDVIPVCRICHTKIHHTVEAFSPP